MDSLESPKNPPGETAAVGAGAAAAPATVTPVLTASAAGIDDRPGVMELLAVKKLPAAIPPANPMAVISAGEPQKQPGGAFCHWVT